MALGAFLAGVLLASSEYQHALETDIEPFKGLLLGLFFISVGMADRFRPARARAARRSPRSSPGLLVLKLVTLWSWRECMGVGARQRWLFAALLAQGGEFAFVVFGVAQTAGVLSADAAGAAHHRGGALDGGDAAHAPRCTTSSPHGGPARRSAPTTRSRNPATR